MKARIVSALVASTIVHAFASAGVGLIVRSSTRHEERLEAIDIDVSSGEQEDVRLGSTASPLEQTSSDPIDTGPRRVTSASARTSGIHSSAHFSPEAAPARFALSAGTVAWRPSSQDGSSGGARVGSSMASDEPAGEGSVAVPARLLSSSPLIYPAAARKAEIEIDLPLEIVVDVGGRVVTSRGLAHAGYGLDEAAERAIRSYRFSPAIREGRPVAVRMRWAVQFRLR